MGEYDKMHGLDQSEDWQGINADLHYKTIDDGKAWAKDLVNQSQARLLDENMHVRTFITEGFFCAASYASPTLGICSATVTYNTVYKSITVAMEDNGVRINAAEFMQSMFGKGAGGHAGIAGSPRGEEQPLSRLLLITFELTAAFANLANEEASFDARKGARPSIPGDMDDDIHSVDEICPGFNTGTCKIHEASLGF